MSPRQSSVPDLEGVSWKDELNTPPVKDPPEPPPPRPSKPEQTTPLDEPVSLSLLRELHVTTIRQGQRLDAMEGDFGKLMAEVGRQNGKTMMVGLITLIVLTYLDRHGYIASWLAAAEAHKPETGTMAAALIVNSVLPRGPRPAGGLELLVWEIRERAAVLTGDRMGGDLKLPGMLSPGQEPKK